MKTPATTRANEPIVNENVGVYANVVPEKIRIRTIPA